MSIIIFHHADNDGWCAGAVAYRELVDRHDTEIKCIEMDYDRPLQYEIGDDVEKIYILDFSFNEEQMEYFTKKVGRENVIWIDHHESAIKKLDKFTDLPGIRTDEWSGAMLTWKYFHPATDDIVPRVVQLVDDYDRWKMHYGELTKNFYEYTIGLDLIDVTNDIWSRLLNYNDEDVKYHSGIGRLDRLKREKAMIKNIDELGVPIKIIWEGKAYKCLLINSTLLESTSQMGEYIYKAGYDIAWMYYYKATSDGEMVKVHQMRSTVVDVSEIATAHGGGGHVNAAGWTEIVNHDVYNRVEVM